MSKDYVKPPKAELKKRLTPQQLEVTQGCGTEPPFKNEYWDNHEPGIYVDVVTGEPLFSSTDKFDSGTGWPSFKRPISDEHVTTRIDRSLWVTRTEVKSRAGDSHLGHVFDDGPGPAGQRFCINSAALRFVPVARLQEEGYGELLPIFGLGGAKDAKDAAPAGKEVAILAGGCFWGMEEILRKIPGVLGTEVGYSGGDVPDATYEMVTTGTTGHAEAVKITFDPRVVSYAGLLGYFFRMHDPTTPNRQGNDAGTQYRSAIFFTSEAQRATALEVKRQVDASGRWKRRVVTEVSPAKPFYRAEEYHQKYLQSHEHGYSCHFLRE